MVDLLEFDPFVVLPGNVDELFQLDRTFALFTEVEIASIDPVINILLE